MSTQTKAANTYVFSTPPGPITTVLDVEPTVRSVTARFEGAFPGVPYTVNVELSEALKLVVIVNPTDSRAVFIQ